MDLHQFCEPLEQRALLSGNVIAGIVNGQLVIRGDAESNAIRISVDPSNPAAILVSGENATTINGQADPLSLTGVVRTANIKLNAGDNQVTIDGLALSRDLYITSLNGADQVKIQNTQVGRHLRILTRGGNDQIDMDKVTVKGWTLINTAQGNDIITATASTFRGKFALFAGAGNDTIQLSESTVESRQWIKPGPGNNQIVEGPIVSKSYNFTRGHLGWRAGYTDYHVGMEPTIDFRTGVRKLPAEVGPGKGYLLSSKNVSDDLFKYIYRQLDKRDGIRPNQTYRVQFTITFASNAGSNLVGIGGAPGESVYLKAGASANQPKRIVNADGYVSSNIDHGNQSQGGTAASVVSNIANGNEVHDGPYVSITREHTHTALIRSDAKGRLYVIVGTDSGFEGWTSLYIQQVNVKLLPVDQPGQEQPPIIHGPTENPV